MLKKQQLLIMNQTTLIKQEIIAAPLDDDCCKAAYLSALMRSCGSIGISNKQLFAQVAAAYEAVKPIKEYLIRLYDIRLIDNGRSEVLLVGQRADELLKDIGIITIVDGMTTLVDGIDKHLTISDCCLSAYVRGVFLGTGGFSIIKKGGYHLQFMLRSQLHAINLIDILRRKNIVAKMTDHQEQSLVYIKGADIIADTLALIGAQRAVLNLFNNVVAREVSRSINRDNNCLYANMDKTIAASVERCRAIGELTQRGLISDMGDDYIKLARIRTDNPNMTYSELAVRLNISKSQVKYKLDKLVKMSHTVQ